MKKATYRVGVVALLCLLFLSCSRNKKVEYIHIVHTTDVHGCLFPYDYVNDVPAEGGYMRVSNYVKGLKKGTDQVVLLDAGDILQGQPTAYYYNFISPLSPHIFATILNQMGYDAITIGNHDIETGHSVYDRFVKQLKMPALGGNVIDVEKDKPYFSPYTILNKGGRKIAVIGTTMTGLVHHLPEKLWSGMRFENQIETVQKYIPEILSQEPDLIIALIHSGIGSKAEDAQPNAENIGYLLAREVPELDLVLMGHDHRQTLDSIVQQDGKVTYLLNPANDGRAVSHTMVYFEDQSDARPRLRIVPEIVSMDSIKPDPALVLGFESQETAVRSFVSETVGSLSAPIDARSAFFGPSTFTDLIHQLQFSVYPQAEVSFTAPLDFNVELKQGEIAFRDLFKLYRYENTLYLMKLTGEEIRGALEESYGRWIQTMAGPNDPLIQIDESRFGGQYLPTANPSYNFDSASGITYTVDVTKPKGERVVITHVGSNPFDPNKTYLVAVNSYRGNGGGGLLTEGAGIPKEELKSRQVDATERDLRFYLIEFLKKNNPYTPRVEAKWSFEPKEWTVPALQRDSLLLYSSFDRHE